MRDCMDRSDEVFGGSREGEQAEEVCWSGRCSSLKDLCSKWLLNRNGTGGQKGAGISRHVYNHT